MKFEEFLKIWPRRQRENSWKFEPFYIKRSLLNQCYCVNSFKNHKNGPVKRSNDLNWRVLNKGLVYAVSHAPFKSGAEWIPGLISADCCPSATPRPESSKWENFLIGISNRPPVYPDESCSRFNANMLACIILYPRPRTRNHQNLLIDWLIS